MVPRVILVAMVVLLLVPLAPVGAAKVAFYESPLITDTANDFGSNGALDIAAVYVAEKFSYNQDTRTGLDVVDFRVELRAIGEMRNLQSQAVWYNVNFKAGGANQNLTVTATWDPNSGKPVVTPKCDPGSSTTCGFATADSIVLRTTSAAAGIFEGAVLADSWASSALATAAAPVYQDLAPHDNANAPSGQSPTPDGYGARYVATGGFPFFVVDAENGLFQYSVLGAEAKFEYEFHIAAGVAGDKVLVLFQVPEGWDLTPSRGTAGTVPLGEFSNVDGGATLAFSFTIQNDQGVEEGVTVPVVMEVVSLSGGHEVVQATVEVSGPKIADPEYTFSLQTPGPFKAGKASVLKAQVVGQSEGPIDGGSVDADLVYQGDVITTVAGVGKGGGTYEFTYSFPNAGDWTFDPYLSDRQPSPHHEFVVHVSKKGGLAPGPGLALLVVALGLVLGVARHRSA